MEGCGVMKGGEDSFGPSLCPRSPPMYFIKGKVQHTLAACVSGSGFPYPVLPEMSTYIKQAKGEKDFRQWPSMPLYFYDISFYSSGLSIIDFMTKTDRTMTRRERALVCPSGDKHLRLPLWKSNNHTPCSTVKLHLINAALLTLTRAQPIPIPIPIPIRKHRRDRISPTFKRTHPSIAK